MNTTLIENVSTTSMCNNKGLEFNKKKLILLPKSLNKCRIGTYIATIFMNRNLNNKIS